MVRRSLNSVSECKQFGLELSKKIKPGSILAFFGPLGAGKTTLIKSIIQSLTQIEEDAITSPTFNICIQYDGVSHFDLYRLKNSDEFNALGFHECFNAETISLIEWAERIEPILPKRAIRIHINPKTETSRIVEYEENSI